MSNWSFDPSPPGFRSQMWPKHKCYYSQKFGPLKPSSHSHDSNYLHLIKGIRRSVGEESLLILRRGSYQLSDGNQVYIREKFRKSVDGAKCYLPDYYFIEKVRDDFGDALFSKMIVEVNI